MKQCSECKKTKPLKEFNKNRKAPDGYQYKCKKCQSDYFKWWRKKNPDKAKKHAEESGRVFREKNPNYNKDYYREKSKTEEGKKYYRDKMNERNRRKREGK